MQEFKSRIKAYYQLTKPGIIRGNIIVAAGGFLFASRGHVNVWLLLATLVGTSLVIASACVFNNYIDRDIDKKMKRTKNRALVTGLISAPSALLYASVLGATGVYVLVAHVNALTAGVGLFGFFAYVVLYGIGKRMTVHGTAIGSISGAIPPVAGYVAVTDRLDLAALLLFLVVVCWQMPHFYAIATYRMKEYAAASIPVLPLVKGMYVTKVHIVLYIGAFTAACFALTALGYTGYVYFGAMALYCLAWLRLAVKGFAVENNEKWARKVFGVSLIGILLFSFMISIDTFLP